MQRVDIPDLLDEDAVYLTRRWLIQTPAFGICLHAIRVPDADRHLHDHPWPFLSVVLRGSYTDSRAPDATAALDQRSRRRLRHRPGVPRLMRRGHFHAIRTLERTPTWTLLVVGRRSQSWGYATQEGWVDHETYHARRRAGETFT